MIVEKILGNIYENHCHEKIVKVNFEWFELDKKRIKKIADDDKEFGILVEEVLKDGDILAKIDDTIYICEILPTYLTKISVSSMQEMGRLCFELGNRHLSLKIEEDNVCVVYDKPTYLYLEKLGFKVSEVTEKFSDFTQCKAHGSSEKKHTHSHSHSHSHSQGHGEHSHNEHSHSHDTEIHDYAHLS